MLVMMMFAYVSALPLEQQEKSLEFPNTAFIPGDLTEQLNVDSFFSLWLFFLDDDVFTSGQSLPPILFLWLDIFATNK